MADSRSEGPQSRPRKCSARTFKGCSTCRQRHVKCDEQTPTCGHCRRLTLPCDYNRRYVFKVVGLSDHNRIPSRSASSSSVIDDVAPPSIVTIWSPPAPESTALDSLSTDPLEAESLLDRGNSVEMASPSGADFIGYDELQDQNPASPAAGSTLISNEEMLSDRYVDEAALTFPPGLSPPIFLDEDFYLSHFLSTVSGLLIIYDTPFNANPYRILPHLDQGEGLLRTTMMTLGASHLCNLSSTQNRPRHARAVAELYGTAIGGLANGLMKNAANLELLAVTLLLCLFEQMSSTGLAWKMHLAGARYVFQSLFSPRPAPSSAASDTTAEVDVLLPPMRRFLVSLMSYLDVAAACAVGEGTLIAGDYWETLGGGWEYNLGVPSLAPPEGPADRVLAQIRHAWSRIMSIQAEISRFSKLVREGIRLQRKEMMREDLSHRIQNWRDSSADIFVRLQDLDKVPAESTDTEKQLLRVAACIDAYTRACVVYLDREATQKLGNASVDPLIASEVDRILVLCLEFPTGLETMAVLWPIFTAGVASTQECHQTRVRDCLKEIQRFGFKNVLRMVQILEYGWLQQKLFGTASYSDFHALASENLVP